MKSLKSFFCRKPQRMVRARLPLVVTGPSCWPVRWSGHLSPGSPTGRPCFKMFKGLQQVAGSDITFDNVNTGLCGC